MSKTAKNLTATINIKTQTRVKDIHINGSVSSKALADKIIPLVKNHDENADPYSFSVFTESHISGAKKNIGSFSSEGVDLDARNFRIDETAQNNTFYIKITQDKGLTWHLIGVVNGSDNAHSICDLWKKGILPLNIDDNQ